MFRGMTNFVCDNCGHKFKGMDIEWCATALSQPLKCPNCGCYHTCPDSFLGLTRLSTGTFGSRWTRLTKLQTSTFQLLIPN